MHVCPTEAIDAPAAHVWRLLTDPRALARWFGTQPAGAPERIVTAGDRFSLRVGLFRVRFNVLDLQAPRRAVLDIGLPFGVANHERIEITSIDATRCRVTFN